MKDVDFVCLNCQATKYAKKHRCIDECHIQGARVFHFDFCQLCQQLVLSLFEVRWNEKKKEKNK